MDDREQDVAWPAWRGPGAGLVARYRSLPETTRLALTALLGAGVGWVTYEILFFLNPFVPRAPTAWLAAFVVSVPRQHALHRWLTFGQSCPYWPSLARAYVFYTALAIATTVLDWWLVEQRGWDHRLAWFACIAATGLASYGLLKRTVFITGRAPGTKKAGSRPPFPP